MLWSVNEKTFISPGMSLSSCNVEQAFGLHSVVPNSPDEGPDNIRMITLKLKLNPNASQGESCDSHVTVISTSLTMLCMSCDHFQSCN